MEGRVDLVGRGTGVLEEIEEEVEVVEDEKEDI